VVDNIDRLESLSACSLFHSTSNQTCLPQETHVAVLRRSKRDRIRHPEQQKQAQEEIDRVVGTGRAHFRRGLSTLRRGFLPRVLEVVGCVATKHGTRNDGR